MFILPGYTSAVARWWIYRQKRVRAERGLTWNTKQYIFHSANLRTTWFGRGAAEESPFKDFNLDKINCWMLTRDASNKMRKTLQSEFSYIDSIQKLFSNYVFAQINTETIHGYRDSDLL